MSPTRKPEAPSTSPSASQPASPQRTQPRAQAKPAHAKSVVVTFRVDSHLAEALERIPDKSAFIRGALQQSLHEICPACNGVGRVDCEAGAWLRTALHEMGARTCSCCGTAFPPALAAASAELDEAPATDTCGHCGPDGHRH